MHDPMTVRLCSVLFVVSLALTKRLAQGQSPPPIFKYCRGFSLFENIAPCEALADVSGLSNRCCRQCLYFPTFEHAQRQYPGPVSSLLGRLYARRTHLYTAPLRPTGH